MEGTEPRVCFKKFLTPDQQGKPVAWPGGLFTTVSKRGHDVRVELHAVGPVAAAILAEVENSLSRGGELG